VRADLKASIADKPAPRHAFTDSGRRVDWLAEMSQRLETRIPNFQSRIEFLRTVQLLPELRSSLIRLLRNPSNTSIGISSGLEADFTRIGGTAPIRMAAATRFVPCRPM